MTSASLNLPNASRWIGKFSTYKLLYCGFFPFLFCNFSAVQAVAMPRSGEQFNAGSRAMVSGWGSLGSGGSPDVLHAVDVPLVSDKVCDENYGGIDAETMICAGEEGRDSCQGDSGGPLVCGEEGSEVLCGVVSWGIGCALDGYPGVYAEASNYIEWLNAHT
jgi:trypsin